MIRQVKIFKYTIVETYPLSDLHKFKDHRRLQTFYHKGCVCVTCGREGTQLILGKDRTGALHVDLYTEDFYPITVDHIIPRSKKGPDHIDNYQPMCSGCNSNKGNGEKHRNVSTLKKFDRDKYSYNISIGDRVFKTKKHKVRELGIISKFLVNPNNGKLSIMLEGNLESMYDSRIIYKLK